MLFRLSSLLKLAVGIFLVLVLIDAAAFRSGLYAPWIEPDSTAGATIGTGILIRHYTDPARKNILLLGNSQIGEGFSWPTADAATGNGALHFINGSIAGTSPRVWNYLLREIDPDADRYAAIAMMVDYDPTLWHGQLADYPLDTPYAAPLLRLSDLFDFPSSFPDDSLRERARRAIMLPMQAMRTDLLDFIAHPLKRRQEIVHGRPAWIAATAVYPGHHEALPDLPINESTGMPSDWGADEASTRPKLEPYFRGLRTTADITMRDANIGYEREWVGRIAARYRAKGVPVIVFSVPRGPWHRLLARTPQPNRALVELSQEGSIQLLPGDAFVQFEQPQFFFDTLHMNHAGREAFSALLAQKIAPFVH